MMHITDILLVLSFTLGQVLGTTIPGHREDITNSVRWLLGKHYYPTTANRLWDNLPASVCIAHSALTLASSQTWSYKMWDASGKIPDGAAAGATEARGHPDLCKSIEINFQGTLESHLNPHRSYLSAYNISLEDLHEMALQKRQTTIRGKYCLVSLRGGNANSNKRIGGGSSQLLSSLAGNYMHTYATCIPDTCTSIMLQESLQTVQEEDSLVNIMCEGEENDEDVSSSEWIFIMVTLILVVLAIAASMWERQLFGVHIPASHDCSPGCTILHCFSIVQNSERLFSCNSTTPAHLQTLDGLRVYSMIWVIATHRYMFFLISAANPNDIIQHMTNWRYSWVFNAYPSVDTFLFVSGFLVSVILKQRLKRFTLSGFYLQRYLRLVPVMLYMIWGCSTVLRHLGSGTVWSRTHHEMFTRPCTQTVHFNLFLMNNFNDSNDMCMGHLWSLAVEWQLYLITPMLLLPLYVFPTNRFRWVPLSTFFCISVLTPAAATLIGNLPPTASYWDYEAAKLYFNTNYVTSWCRGAPYCVGLAAGYLYHWMDENNITLSAVCIRIGKVLSLITAVAVLVSPCFIAGHGKYWAALYSSLSRPAWGLVMAFVVLNACKGQPGFWVWLSSRSWVTPICRVSYCMFLVSLPLQTMASARPQKLHYDHVTALYLVIGDLVLSYVSAVILHLLVECPLSRLINVFTLGRKQCKEKLQDKVEPIIENVKRKPSLQQVFISAERILNAEVRNRNI